MISTACHVRYYLPLYHAFITSKLQKSLLMLHECLPMWEVLCHAVGDDIDHAWIILFRENLTRAAIVSGYPTYIKPMTFIR